jgi:hypothetical protein
VSQAVQQEEIVLRVLLKELKASQSENSTEELLLKLNVQDHTALERKLPKIQQRV